MRKFLISLLILFVTSAASWAGERINLAFNIDDNYATYMLLTINSIFKHNDSNSEYYIYVLENDLSQKNKARIKKFIEKNNQHIEFVNISQAKLDAGKSHYESCEPISQIAFARIYLPELLPDINRILYLDSDLLVLSDIKELYDTNISGYAMGMVPDFSYVYGMLAEKERLAKRGIKLKVDRSKSYCNSGVILMDLNFFRKHNLTQVMIDYSLKHPNLLYADQDVLNNSMRPYIKIIDSKWNNQFYSGLTLTSLNNGGIIHYISSVKPWMTFPKKSHPERYMYFQNWFSSEFRFYYINAVFKRIAKAYKNCISYSINNIKLKLGYPNKYQETIYIAFTIDDNYWLYTLLTINSILKNNTSHSPYHFYIVENNLTDKNKQKMMKYVTRHHQEIEFINVDTTSVDGGENLYQKTRQHQYISRIAMARIFLPNLLPKDLKKVLYLDSDLLVTRDLRDLFDIDITQYPVAMAGDLTEYIKKKPLKNKKGEIIISYYNDGVMLMNLDYWRKHKLTETMINYMKVKKYLPKMDQDLINIILKNKVKTLDVYWNNQYGFTHANAGKGIIHYIGSFKPWVASEIYYRAPGLKHRKLYHKYWSRSPFFIYQIPIRLAHINELYVFFGQSCFVDLSLWNFKDAKR